MEITISKFILAAVTLDKELVAGGVPIFLARDEEERERISMYLGRSLEGVVHDLENGVYIVVKH